MMIVPILWHGYTVGKRIMGIRIVRVDGEKIGIGTMLLRYVIAALFYGDRVRCYCTYGWHKKRSQSHT